MRARLRGLDTLAEDLTAALDGAISGAMEEIAERVARSAQRRHPYTNRTGDLEASTQSAGIVTGSLASGAFETGVYASEEYASYVDEKMPFLQPAWDDQEYTAVRILEYEMEGAAKRIVGG